VRRLYPDKVLNLLSDIWANEIEKINDLKYDKILLDHNLLTQF